MIRITVSALAVLAVTAMIAVVPVQGAPLAVAAVSPQGHGAPVHQPVKTVHPTTAVHGKPATTTHATTQPKTTTTTRAPKTTAGATKTTKSTGAMKTAKSTGATKKTTATGTTKTTGNGKATKTAKTTPTSGGTTGSDTTTEPGTTPSGTPTGEPGDTSGSGTTLPEPTGPAVQHLKKQPQLAQKLGGLLPQGTDVMQAASGFKNLGQFVAAVHVSNNQGIPFAQLKEQMVAPNNKSLGQAVQTLKPGTSTEAVTQAETQASVEVKATVTSGTTTTTTTGKTKTPKKKTTTTGNK